MDQFFKLFVLFFFISHDNSFTQELQRYQFQSRHKGTQINIILYSENDSIAKEASDAAFYRIEELNQILSDYIDESELNQLSRLSGSGDWMKILSLMF